MAQCYSYPSLLIITTIWMACSADFRQLGLGLSKNYLVRSLPLTSKWTTKLYVDDNWVFFLIFFSFQMSFTNTDWITLEWRSRNMSSSILNFLFFLSFFYYQSGFLSHIIITINTYNMLDYNVINIIMLKTRL